MATIAVEYLGGSDDDALYLPCKDSELEKVLRAIRSDGGNEIIITNVMWPEGLSILNGQTVDVDELNYLAKRLDSFVPSEYLPFYAAVQITPDMDMEKLINLSFNTAHYTLIQDVSDPEQVGKLHYMNLHGGITENERKTIDFGEIGRKLLTSGKGVPTTFGLLFENQEVPFETVYNGVNFPAYYCKADFIAGVRLDYNGRSEYLYLPEETVTIEKALKRLDCPNCYDCTVTVDAYGNIDEIWQDRMDDSLEYEGIYEANHRAEILSRPGLDKGKLLKVFGYSEEVSTEALQRLADHLDDFIVIPGAETAVDVAEYFMQHEDGYRVDEYARDYVDFQKMGEYLITERDGQFVSGGFVCMEENCSFERIMGRESPGMEMKD